MNLSFYCGLGRECGLTSSDVSQDGSPFWQVEANTELLVIFRKAVVDNSDVEQDL